jgi:hypothetical protein
MVNNTKLNLHRLNRIEKTVEFTDDLKKEAESINKKLLWLVIAEPWCGDVAQNLPVISKIAGLSGNITLRIILRDENPEVMDLYLTNGGRAIPVLICLEPDTFKELGKWGPRPSSAQAYMREMNSQGVDKPERIKNIQLWYANDNYQTIQKEFTELIKEWKNK